MTKKIMTLTAAAALLATAGLASAQPGVKTDGGAGLFDQGGAYYNGTNHNTSSDVYGGNIDRSHTASVRKVMRHGKGNATIESNITDDARIPSDTRNERGLGMFDSVVR